MCSDTQLGMSLQQLRQESCILGLDSAGCSCMSSHHKGCRPFPPLSAYSRPTLTYSTSLPAALCSSAQPSHLHGSCAPQRGLPRLLGLAPGIIQPAPAGALPGPSASSPLHAGTSAGAGKATTLPGCKRPLLSIGDSHWHRTGGWQHFVWDCKGWRHGLWGGWLANAVQAHTSRGWLRCSAFRCKACKDLNKK